MMFLLTLLIVLLVSITFTIIVLLIDLKNKSKFLPKVKIFKGIVVFYLLFGLGLSIKPSVEITIAQAQNILTIEWTICAILLALLVTWCLVIEKNLTATTKPITGIKNRFNLYINRYLRRNYAIEYLWNITPAIISLILLISVSGNIYIQNLLNWITQTILYFVFYLLTYSIILITTDIIAPTLARVFLTSLEKFDEKEFIIEMTKGISEDLNIKYDESLQNKILKLYFADKQTNLELPKAQSKNRDRRN